MARVRPTPAFIARHAAVFMVPIRFIEVERNALK